MAILGAALLILGFLLHIHLLWVFGIVLLVCGIVLLFVRPGNRYYY
jgi:hypothetical protein